MNTETSFEDRICFTRDEFEKYMNWYTLKQHRVYDAEVRVDWERGEFTYSLDGEVEETAVFTLVQGS